MIETKFIGVCKGCDKIKKVTEQNWCRKCLTKSKNELLCVICKKPCFVDNSYITERNYWCEECYEMEKKYIPCKTCNKLFKCEPDEMPFCSNDCEDMMALGEEGRRTLDLI